MRQRCLQALGCVGLMIVLSCSVLLAIEPDDKADGDKPADTEAVKSTKSAARASKRNPHTSASDINQGRNFFRVWCARCHGLDARGAKGPDLTNGVFRHVRNDEELYNVVANGIPGTDMSGFGDGGETAEGEVVWQMVAYIRQEEKKRGATAGKQPSGDIKRGLALFKKHKCATCQWTGKDGGRRGSDLSRLAAGPDFVRRSILDPDARIGSGYQLVQLLMNDGRLVTGRRLNENTYFMLLMDEKENLVAVRKNQIEEISRPHKSLMPSFKEHLKAGEIEDLTTYILSLRKGASK